MRKLFSLFLALVATASLWAHDFQSGNLYYNITSGTTVEVTSQTSSYPYNEGVALRVATIPSTVTHNGTTYNVTSIGDWAFRSCSSLTSITIPNSVTSIGNYAFYGCTSLTSITIPNSVESTGRSMCSYCYDLCSVTIGNSLKHIGLEAFYSCSSLTSVTIPNSVTSIGDYAFFKCSSLDSIYVEALTPPALGEFKNTPASICYVPCGTLTAYEASDWAQYVSEFVEDCKVDSTMIITYTSTNGNVVTPYTSDVFGVKILSNEYKDGQGVITFDGPVTSIGDSAFYDCSSLTSITIPERITSIGDRAFSGCSSFVSITCEATTPPILGTDVFYDTKLSAVYIPDNTLSAYQQAWGAEYTYINNETILSLHVEVPGTLSDLIFDAGTRPINVVKLTLTGTLNDDDFTCMRETMTSLEDVDLLGITNTSGVNFKNKTNLVRVVLPANLTSIGDYAFYDCSLASITIPNSVTSIESAAFYSCNDLTSVTFGNSVTSIEKYAFNACSSLTSVTIPNSVTRIGEETFAQCRSLSSMVVESGNTTYDSRNNCNAIIETSSNTLIAGCQNTIIPNSVTSIGNGAFYGFRSLTSITIPNSVTSIGRETFAYCFSLTSVIIPNSVTSIGGRAFYSCNDLTSITIPNSVTSIGDDAFGSCSSLTSITCLGTTPPNASNLGAPTSTCTLTVPQSAYNAYLRHAYWGQFLNIYTGYLVTLQANNDQWGEVSGDGLYTNDTTITITATPYEGYTFLRWSDGNTDNPRTIQVTSDTTLTAEFVEYRDMTIVFTNSEDGDSEILSQTITIKIPAAPEIEGFTFLYWQPVAEPLTDTITIQAIYKSNASAAAPEIYVNPANPAQKLLRNGQVYILKDDKTYTIMGAQIQ